MNTVEIPPSPLRRKRRPAQSCEQCRRRKIKCDRNAPCRQCARANIETCVFIRDTRTELTTAPFASQDTQFLVFDQRSSISESSPENALQEVANGATYADVSSEQGSNAPESHVITPSDASAGSPIHSTSLTSSAYLSSVLAGTSFLSHSAFPRTVSSVRGAFIGNKFYGHSHWLNYALPPAVLSNQSTGLPSRADAVYASCKQLGQIIKHRGEQAVHTAHSIKGMLPSQEVTRQLVQAYLRTMQAVFGILHVPSFLKTYKEFWENDHEEEDSFAVILLSILSMGSIFAANVSRANIARWLHSAAQKISKMSSISIEKLRVQCLFTLACHTCFRKASVVSASPGALLQSGLKLGLHIDPEDRPFSNLSPAETQTRRKLWVVILELVVQSSLDKGLVPSISAEDYDTKPPSNIDDDDMGSSPPKPLQTLTQSSMPILLLELMRVRLKIARLVNDFKPLVLTSYETALELSSELSKGINVCNDLIEAYQMSSRPPTDFQIRYFQISTSRFKLALHAPFARQTSPSYHYSQKVCIETAMEIAATYSKQALGNDFHMLQIRGGGHSRNVYRECAMVIAGELLRPDPYQSPSLDSGKRFHENGCGILQSYMHLAEARMRDGDKSFKCYLLISFFLAKTNAMCVGIDADTNVRSALEKALNNCYELLSLNVPDAGATREATPETALTDGTRYGWPGWRSFSIV